MALRNPLSIQSAIARAEAEVTRQRAPRRLTAKFLVTAAVLSAVVAGSVVALTSRFSLAIATQESLCLPPYRVWVIDKTDREPVRGDIFAFKSKGLSPLFVDGTTVVKVLKGMPGDSVAVGLSETRINNQVVAHGLDVAAQQGIDPARYVRDTTIAPDRFWFFGETADSFDSRYWGSAGYEQIMGKAYPIW
ncbi:S26 family signal peptidase [Pseudomonas sp. FSL W5-0299]|uniref:S26 family signal peptidase n=1 Tax=Pseudomonas sp. FSL W5-0299 TaxID=1917484 RepID=UPI00098B041D|nr:S26 family signal peptidase [Pseudomonas sp. FSL W5-0299]